MASRRVPEPDERQCQDLVNRAKNNGTHVSVAEVKEMWQAYNILDESGDGQVNLRELRAAIVSLGLSVDSAALTKIMQGVGGDDAQLSFNEFFDKMTATAKEHEKLEEIMKIFMLFDEDRTGTISVANIEKVALQLGEKLDKSQLEDMVKLIDSDGDGEISPEDFYLVLTRGAEAKRRKQQQQRQG
ncbi:unnamed protein product [Vitrella brassicaformis CCMP3155]|uniref:EF-hand domain-containing protein n=1 Tax=Vitrella brassicaformis (strain CCMP3155) TaxID=1169540 RepID=A0A0G4EAH1_VITBC|nr:unnamed protein product [Vitrella brassicaformis CCMP3155]|eukprot:CEL92956.1 unnamed protein product [Vitrella brassicaformis CCMP3155]